MSSHKTIELDKYPWQIALFADLLLPLEKGEAVCFSEGHVRRALPQETVEGVIEDRTRSKVFKNEYIYDIMTDIGIDIYYAAPDAYLLPLLIKHFSKDTE